ncbi:MAG: DUF3408 domain-containing protein [Bacteroidales bacterium]|nr:DUF3408 domain-containing protein [Bacteroidales bacterium]
MSSKKKQKQISIEEYVEIYCREKRIRGRSAVYISPGAHCNLRSIAQLFKCKHHTTTSSLADAIICRHIETYRELLNNAHAEDAKEFMEWLKLIRHSRMEELSDDDYPLEKEEAESCEDNDSEEE